MNTFFSACVGGKRVFYLPPMSAQGKRFLPWLFIVNCITLTQLLPGCTDLEKPEVQFVKLEPEKSGVTFVNELVENAQVNILTYEYAYNGGGVAAADFNNDGLCDLYFTGNTVPNKLYLNRGDLHFEDVTSKSSVGGRSLWKTGVAVADVNADGWLDMYVCYSGPELKQSFSNELYINQGVSENGVPVFREQAREYGLSADSTFSTQAAFFDYDRDGDLDMFLLNHGNHFYSPFINTKRLRNSRHPQFGNRLYRNDAIVKGRDAVSSQNKFVEVSNEAGIHGGGINFGLGISISDVNNDGWPDIFVTNDYEEQDFLYINNQDGTFREQTRAAFGHISRNGMGTDIADINNDGWPDLIEADMWPEDNYRQKLLKGPDDYNRYQLMLDSGFHHQQMRNTLQLNAGMNKDNAPVFCEIGQLAGISSTDWSWAPLLADFDNDGFRDLFVSNGYLRDFTSMDFLKYTVEDAKRKAQQSRSEVDVYQLVRQMPSTKTSDYIFKNNGDLTFTDVRQQWGLDEPNLSFGAAYADLDNDGDLEIITNNTNEQANIWLNQQAARHKFLRIKLKGVGQNRDGFGAKITAIVNGKKLYGEMQVVRGFQSSVEPIVHFGLGNIERVDTLSIAWPDGTYTELQQIQSNQTLEVRQEGITIAPLLAEQSPSIRDITPASGLSWRHRENNYNDFDNEPLLPYQLSTSGPALAVGDVNGDSLDDVYLGGAMGQPGELHLATLKGGFAKARYQPWETDAEKEDTDAIFFDADNDQDLDLFVVSGSIEHRVGSGLDDRLYLNDGAGYFSKAASGTIIDDHASGSCVDASDFDNDGDIDLYVGGRVKPGSFPMTTPGAILRNDFDIRTKELKFSVVTRDVAPELREPGMVTDVLWSDVDNDGWKDLLVVGDWMAVRIFRNHQGRFKEISDSTLSQATGWWRKIEEVDVDGDRDMDYVVGNAGVNMPWKVSQSNPLILYYKDFNSDERIDPVMAYSHPDGNEYPLASRDELLTQVNLLRKKFVKYADYGKATVLDIFPDLNSASRLSVQTLESIILINEGQGRFSRRALPVEAQLSAVHGIVHADINSDDIDDLLVAGNFFRYRTQYGPSDAGIGLVLLGRGNGGFAPAPSSRTGFYAPGDVRAMRLLRAGNNKKYLLVARNNDKVSVFEIGNLNPL